MANSYYTYVSETNQNIPDQPAKEKVSVQNDSTDSSSSQTRFHPIKPSQIKFDRHDSRQAASSAAEAIPVDAYIIDEPATGTAPKSKIGSAVTIAVGGCVALVGVPMLVLPGPGLLAIGGGVALMVKGAKGLIGK